MQLSLSIIKNEPDVRRRNVLSSPKFGGSCDVDSRPYLRDLGVEIVERRIPIQFTPNFSERVHRWAPYIQGFSAGFVQQTIDQYRHVYPSPVILDPFAGCGTVLVQAKLSGLNSIGTELNPLLQYIADIKVNSWDVEPDVLLRLYSSMSRNVRTPAPEFLKSDDQFNPEVLKNLELLKGGIDNIVVKGAQQERARDLLCLAFSSILIDCSNLKRTPCLGYWKGKRIRDNAPWVLIDKKIKDIADDLKFLQKEKKHFLHLASKIALANAMEYAHREPVDLVITSPPYMNGLDYVMNYKIEMGWLGFIKNHKDAKRIKDDMVVCDNVSKGLIRRFAQSETKYSDPWLDEIMENIEKNIRRRGAYRRTDMPHIVHKYFDDMYRVMKNVSAAMKPNSRFILVVGDSLIADVYVPTDLILAKMGTKPEISLSIDRLEKARKRHSGQIRNYRLRETIVTLRKSAPGE